MDSRSDKLGQSDTAWSVVPAGPRPASADIQTAGRTGGSAPPPQPDHASLLAVDLTSFGSLRTPAQLNARGRMYGMLREAFDEGGLPWADCTHEDRGDGALTVVPGRIPKTLLLGPVIEALIGTLGTQPEHDPGRLRLRIAVHAGEVHRDAHGLVGYDVNHVFRLLDCAQVKEPMRAHRTACAVIVSDPVYQSVVRHGYGPGRPEEFVPTRVLVKEDSSTAWLHVPGDLYAARHAASREHDAATPAADRATVNGVHINAGGDVSLKGARVVGGNMWASRVDEGWDV